MKKTLITAAVIAATTLPTSQQAFAGSVVVSSNCNSTLVSNVNSATGDSYNEIDVYGNDTGRDFHTVYSQSTSVNCTANDGNSTLDVVDGLVTASGNVKVTGNTTVSGKTLSRTLEVTGTTLLGTSLVDSLAAGEIPAGLDMSGTRITGVADAVYDDDAVAYRQLTDVRSEARRGIAISYAMQPPHLEAGKKYAMTVGVGNFNDKNAIGVAGKGRVNDAFSWYVGIGGSGSEYGGALGLTKQW